MDLVAVQISVTVILLISQLGRVVWDRIFQPA